MYGHPGRHLHGAFGNRLVDANGSTAWILRDHLAAPGRPRLNRAEAAARDRVVRRPMRGGCGRPDCFADLVVPDLRSAQLPGSPAEFRNVSLIATGLPAGPAQLWTSRR